MKYTLFLTKEGLQGRPDVIQQLRLGVGVGVQAVGLEHFPVCGETFEKEGNQGGSVLLGQLRKELAELSRILHAVVGGKLHAYQHCPGPSGAAGFEHGLQVGAGGAQGQTPQAVISAQLDHHHRRPVGLQGGGDAVGASLGGFAADAGVDHLPTGLFLRQLDFQQAYPIFARGEAVARREAVAEHQQGAGAGHGGQTQQQSE